ncbi:hypothetical protein Vadar_014690 [Vaccinium darrowii]|uniref:Uncharacterized protein n=1 Tax=Vaccinium darrowii TaxID=229202 RepID=A0ACB7ZJ88_9ERIC|nr:hypothetical protein Vadar_014690 [Vaccinium darrowii]
MSYKQFIQEHEEMTFCHQKQNAGLISFFCLIIRSHEGPDAREKRPGLGGMDEGYTIDDVVESAKLITLFSAPDYPQFQALKPVIKSMEMLEDRPTVEPACYWNISIFDSGKQGESVISRHIVLFHTAS